MPKLALLALVFFASCSLPVLHDNDPKLDRNQISLIIGERALSTRSREGFSGIQQEASSADAEEFDDLDEQLALGVEFVLIQPGSLGWEGGISHAQVTEDDILGFDVTRKFKELYFGVRKDFGSQDSKLSPYLGAGMALVIGEILIDSFEAEESSFGAYLHGGLGYKLTPNSTLGFDVRWLTDTDFKDDLDADYLQLSLVLGWTF